MLYRKLAIKKHKYFLKSIHGLWIIPIVMINFIVPLFNFFLYKSNKNDMEIDIEKVLFFFLPMLSVWTGIFVSEIFFSEKTKDVLFFYSNKEKFKTSLLYFLFFSADSVIIVLLHFYCVKDFPGLSLKILSVSIFYYGLSMLSMYFSKSATITIMILLLYDLANTFITGSGFFLLYENFDKLDLAMTLRQYLPLIIIAAIFIFIVFKKTRGGDSDVV